MTEETNVSSTTPTPDPWDLAAAGQPATTADMIDVVAAAQAEVVDIQQAADEELKAHVDAYQSTRAQLAGAVAVINADTDALIEARSKRLRALKTARIRGRRWFQAAGRLRKARADLKEARHALANEKSSVAFLLPLKAEVEALKLAGEWDGLAAALNYTHWQQATAEAADLREQLANKHAGEYTDTGAAAEVTLDVALLREDKRKMEAKIEELERELAALKAGADEPSGESTASALDATIQKVIAELRKHGAGLYLGELQRMVRADDLNRALTAGVKAKQIMKPHGRNYYTLPEFARRAESTEPPTSEPAERDEVAELLAVLREYGYEAYADGTRNNSAEWLRKRLANIGAPVPGGAKLDAAG